MGNSNSSQFDNHNWQFVSKPSTYDIVSDERSGLHAEKHIILNNPTIAEKDQMEVYHYRNLTNKPIVKVYNAEYGKSKGGCGAAKEIIVHSEYIPHRLSDTKNLNHGQALYVLSESLAGFHELHHRFGPFQITDDHIGFNEIGQAKVWHSPNFATNHLDRDSIILMSTTNPKNFDDRMERRQQQEMVEDIWMAVDQHANISKQFTDKANHFRQKSFLDARRLVAEEIAKGQTYVPDYLNFEGTKGTINQSNLQGTTISRPNVTSVYQNSFNQSQGNPVSYNSFRTPPQVQGAHLNSYQQAQPQTTSYKSTISQYMPSQSYETSNNQYQSYYSQNFSQVQAHPTGQLSQAQAYQASPWVNSGSGLGGRPQNQPQTVRRDDTY